MASLTAWFGSASYFDLTVMIFRLFIPNEACHSGCHYCHDDVIKWKHIPRYWPFVRGIHRSPVNSPHQGQWRGAIEVFYDLRLNKRSSKQSWGWWFETPSRPLIRHCNVSIFEWVAMIWGGTDNSLRSDQTDGSPWNLFQLCLCKATRPWHVFDPAHTPSPPGQNGRHFDRHF